jgi:RNA polymerase sigma-70 factor (ECF subfamily)
LYAYIFALVRNLDDAQEIYQQTCLVLWQRFHDFTGDSEFSTWACGIARNKVMDLHKARRRHQAKFSADFQEHIAKLQMRVSNVDIDDRREALAGCLEKLREGERDLVRDCYGSDQSVLEVAERLNRTTHSVYNSLRRVRFKLMECIDRAIARADRGDAK